MAQRLRFRAGVFRNRIGRLANPSQETWPSSMVGPEAIEGLMKLYGIGRSALGRVLGATPVMVWKWSTGEAEPTGPAKMLIHYLATGQLKVDPREFIKKRGRKRKEDRLAYGTGKEHLLGMFQGSRLSSKPKKSSIKYDPPWRERPGRKRKEHQGRHTDRELTGSTVSTENTANMDRLKRPVKRI